MTDKPDPAAFSKVEFPGEYEVQVEVFGIISKRIKAESQDDAARQAGEWAEKIEESGEAELDEVYGASVDLVTPRRALYRVTQDGMACQVSYLSPGDQPREPDERGF